MAGVAGMVLAAGVLASCGGAGTGTSAGAGPSPAPLGGSGRAGSAAAGPCAAPAGSAGPRMPMLPRPGSVVLSYQLNGVAVLSAASAWAVGTTDSTDPRVVHWDGSTWTERVLSLSPGRPGNPPGGFQAVAAVSAGDVWAVGVNTGGLLAEHWDGRAWTVVRTPTPSRLSGSVFLQGIAAASARDIWAVGGSEQPVIVHWDGRTWTIVPSPVPPGASTDLLGVAAVSAVSAWAVGYTWPTGGTQVPLIEQWNGTAWAVVPSPAIPGGGTLTAVAAASPRDAWAVGARGGQASGGSGLIEHWDGRTWTIVPSPDLAAGGAGGELHAVTIVRDGSAWAVGGAFCPRQGSLTVIEHWDGRTWSLVPSPASGELDGVAAASPSSAWAVGSWSASAAAIIEHWNGTAWTWPAGFCAAPSGPGCDLPSTTSSSP